MTADLLQKKQGFVGATFTLRNRLMRLAWRITWVLLARWTPPFMHRWRIGLVRLFGGDVSYRSYIYPDVIIWGPWNLKMDEYAALGSGVICYNIAPVILGIKATVSQYSYLCSASHDYRDPTFPLFAKPIHIGAYAWLCARSLVGPGVDVGEGAILSAGGIAMTNLNQWSIYAGNPAVLIKQRPPINA